MVDNMRVIKRIENLMNEVEEALKMGATERVAVYGEKGLELIVQTIRDSLEALKSC